MCTFYAHSVNTCYQYNELKASPSEFNEHTFFMVETPINQWIRDFGVSVCFETMDPTVWKLQDTRGVVKEDEHKETEDEDENEEEKDHNIKAK